MRKLLSPLLAVAMLLGVWRASPAQETSAGTSKPLLTVSFAGYDVLKGDIATIGKLGGNPGLADGLEGLLTLATQGKGLAGLDKTKPWGAVLLTSGQEQTPDQFSGYAFVPVTDLKQLMSLKPDRKTGQPLAPGADGVYEIKNSGGKSVYVMQKGGWALLVQDREMFKQIPADPTAVLGDLTKQYALAVRVAVKNLPPAIRQSWLADVEKGTRAQLKQKIGEDDASYAARVAMTKQSLKQITAAFNDMDELLLGLNFDASRGSLYVDLKVTAQPGTASAGQMANLKNITTDFAGFLVPEAAVTANWADLFSDADLAQAKSALATLRASTNKELDNSGDLSKEQVQVAKQLLADALDVAEKTLESKKIDCGLALTLLPGGSTVVAGARIADGDKLNKVVKNLVAELSKDEPELAKSVKLDAETHEGVKLHTFSLPVTSEDAVPLLGEKIDIVLGISADRLFVGAGRDALKMLKEAITKSKASPAKQIAPLQISVAGGPIAKFSAQVGSNPMAMMLAGLLEKSAGKDHVTITATAVENGANVRLELEEGVLKMIVGMSQMMGPGMPGGGMPPPGAMPPGSGSSPRKRPAQPPTGDEPSPF